VRRLIAALLVATIGVGIGVAIDRTGTRTHPQVPLATRPIHPYVIPASKQCLQIEHSGESHPVPPPPATLLKSFTLSNILTLDPLGSRHFAGVSESSVWQQWLKTEDVQRLAHYRVFLARASDFTIIPNRVVWVILDRGTAGPFDASVPYPGPTSIPACVIYGNGETVYDAQTGKEYLSGGGGDMHPNPFSPKHANWWRL
jgi:hypothetical protein